MAEPTPPDRTFDRPGVGETPWAMIGVLVGAAVVRVAAAVVVEWAAGEKLCLFDDTRIYWHLAGAILKGEPYVVSQYGIPHYALRTPGYPLFLAACRAVFGPSTMAVRLVQSALGVVSVWLLMRLVRRLGPAGTGRGWRSLPMLAGLIAAVEPYSAATSALILSEALFVPLMLAMLWGLAAFWPGPGSPAPRSAMLTALATGLAAGAAVLTRPSWALFVPLVLVAWVLLAGRDRRILALQRAAVVGLGVVLTMTPWWARNAQIYGRFVPTALWLGASLYDGLRPDADGSSDMWFTDDPAIRRLDEVTQDAYLRDAALTFARDQPGRVLELAAIKAARFWSPWPNADTFSSFWINLASAVVTIPLYMLMLWGIWECRRDVRALVLLAGPLLYFAALHLIFVGSIRYRIPAAVPAFGLAAFGLARGLGKIQSPNQGASVNLE